MKNNIGKKAYCFEKLTGGIGLDGKPCVDDVTLVLRMCDVIDYNSETKQYVVRTQFLNKNISCNSAFFNKDELKEFFESFFLKNDILDFNNEETCYLCYEIYTKKAPVKELCILLTKRKISELVDQPKHHKYCDIFFNAHEIHNRVSGLLNDGILEELTF